MVVPVPLTIASRPARRTASTSSSTDVASSPVSAVHAIAIERRHEIGQLVDPDRALGDQRAVDSAVVQEHPEDVGEQRVVGAGTHREVTVGERGGLRAPRVDHPHRPARARRSDVLDRDSGWAWTARGRPRGSSRRAAAGVARGRDAE